MGMKSSQTQRIRHVHATWITHVVLLVFSGSSSALLLSCTNISQLLYFRRGLCIPIAVEATKSNQEENNSVSLYIAIAMQFLELVRKEK